MCIRDSQCARGAGRAALLVMLEVLHRALVLLRRGAAVERAEVATPLGPGVLLQRIEAVASVSKFPNHGFPSGRWVVCRPVSILTAVDRIVGVINGLVPAVRRGIARRERFLQAVVDRLLTGGRSMRTRRRSRRGGTVLP